MEKKQRSVEVDRPVQGHPVRARSLGPLTNIRSLKAGGSEHYQVVNTGTGPIVYTVTVNHLH